MDHLRKLKRGIRVYLFLLLLLSYCGLLTLAVLAIDYYDIDPVTALLFCIPSSVALAFILSSIMTNLALEPLTLLRQAILHVSPDNKTVAPPNIDNARLGKELLSNLTMQVYQLASHESTSNSVSQQTRSLAENAVANLPMPIIVIGKDQTILYANHSAADYIEAKENLVGKNVYSCFDWSFPSDQTLDAWLKDCQANKLTASTTWNRVKLRRSEQDSKQLDLVAYYNKNNPSGAETIIALFDRTEEYGQDDQAISYVALAIHELRTPLTTLRGYIEVFDEELSGKLDPELTGFMHKMQASAQNLTAFVNNILNVARIENNQLVLQLQETNWKELVTQITTGMMLRAQVHGKQIKVEIDSNLPTVGADPTAATEILTNLIDNAVKYSGTSDTIIVKAITRADGQIETTVQDHGVGIPIANMGNLFEKFYRSHRTRAHIGGTGLGLYLCKTLVKAHGGDIWARSKEQEGTTIGFTLQPYSKVAQSKSVQDGSITRTAHGWIKNHSFYRR